MSTKKPVKPKKTNKYDSMPKNNEVELGKCGTDLITGKNTFEYYNKPTRGEEFIIFREIGQEITGQIIGHAITNIRRNSSYPLKLAGGRVIEFFANKQLHGIIRDFELIRAHVRIVYIGRNHNSWGHATKVYRVYKIKDGLESGPLVSHLKSVKLKRSKKNVKKAQSN